MGVLCSGCLRLHSCSTAASTSRYIYKEPRQSSGTPARRQSASAAEKAAATDGAFWAGMDIPAHVAFYIAQGMSKSDAIKKAAKDRGVPKNTVYQEMVGR